MTTQLSDYVTTETVMQALGGAKDLAKTGAELTVQYYTTQAITDIAGGLLFSLIGIAGIIYGLLKKRNGASDFDALMKIIGVICGGILLIVGICITCNAVAVYFNPEGALIYKVVTGAAK